jgi:pimeloyl-ACP methyl ester carboxylesterase
VVANDPRVADDLPPGGRRLTSPDGEQIVLHDWGGTGPALLFTHGNGLNAAMWSLVVDRLRRWFRCYGLDLRGHGWCRPHSEDFSVRRERFADDVLVAVDAIGEPLAGVGHSLGGGALLHAALRRPGTFRSLWLFEPVVIPDTMERPPGPPTIAEGARRRRVEFESVAEATERFLSKRPYDRCRPEAVRAYVEAGTVPVPGGGVRLTCSGITEARIYESGEAEDFGRFATVRCPTVVAVGDLIEGEMPAVIAPLVADALARGRLRRFSGLTHLGPMEDTDTVADAITHDVGD